MRNFLSRNKTLALGLAFTCFFHVKARAGAEDGTDGNGQTDQGHYSQPRFHSSISLREGYDDNVETSQTNKIRSAFTDLEGNVFANLGNERTTFTIGLTGGVTYYDSRPGDKYQELGSLTLNVAHKVNERLTLSLSSYTTYQTEPDFTLLVAQNRVNGQYLYTGDNLSATYQWTRRFSTVTSYQLVGIFYQDSALKMTNDYVAHNFSNEFRYLVHPTTTLVLDYQLGLVEYLYQTQRNALSNTLSVGFDHSFSPKFNMTLRAGGTTNSQQGSGMATSPYGVVTLNYAYRRNSSISGYLNYGFSYSDLTVDQSDKSLRMGVTINQTLSHKLSAYLGLFYEHDDFSSGGTLGALASSSTEDTINISTGIRFTVNPHLTLQASYTRTQLLSSIASQEYDQDVVSIGGSYGF